MRLPAIPAALLLASLATAAHADGFSLGDVFQNPSPPRAQVRQAAHNRYAPCDGIEEVPAGRVFASGHYESKARAEGLHNRYAD